MTSAAEPRLMTTEDLLALPDDGVKRWLIRGQLREQPSEFPGLPRTVRNRTHSRITASMTYFLEDWLRRQPLPRGSVLCGEAGCRLRGNPESTVGIDVVYVSPEVAARESDDTTLIDGVPVLVVEILSPNDTQEQIDEMIDDYLQAGVAVVWVIDPHDRTVLIYRKDMEPELVTVRLELTAEPQLPGFRLAAAQLFS
jgi:Uma2 family endonuclease